MLILINFLIDFLASFMPRRLPLVASLVTNERQTISARANFSTFESASKHISSEMSLRLDNLRPKNLQISLIFVHFLVFEALDISSTLDNPF